MATSGTAVSLSNVRKTYRIGEPVHALDGVSLEVPQGSYTAIMGPSGSGKSTLMNLVGCLDTPTEGTVVVGVARSRRSATANGPDFGDRGRLRLPDVQPDAAAECRRERGVTAVVPERRPVRAPRACARPARARRPGRPGGSPAERTIGRPAPAGGARRALVNDPAIVLADEPSGNLDTDTESDILDLFDEFHGGGTTMLVVTHERHVAERADRIIHLLDGKIERIEDLKESGESRAGPTTDRGSGREGRRNGGGDAE